uniref:WAP domain-containing protein n=1 Tax=Monodelphis domestica TaxID=13616 RepID=F7FYE5_MONDO
MRAQGLLLLAALLVLGSELPGAEGRRKGERSGGCPPDDQVCRPGIPHQCLVDKQCPKGKKCCQQACFLQCVARVMGMCVLCLFLLPSLSLLPRVAPHAGSFCVSVKSGQCPPDPLRCLSATQHLCTQDKNCSGLKRCCPTACGRDCRDPVRGASLTPQRRDVLTTAWPSSPGLLTRASPVGRSHNSRGWQGEQRAKRGLSLGATRPTPRSPGLALGEEEGVAPGPSCGERSPSG